MDPSRYLPRTLPDKLTGLADLALDLRWLSNHAADRLWQQIDPELWEYTRDPWMMLESISDERLDELLHDPKFLSQLSRQLATQRSYLEQRGWYQETYGGDNVLNCIAYFSMEFGLNESLPIYSGGLGILAGDYLKAASDLSVPIVGIGLLYQQGYFRQAFDQDGDQMAFFPYNNPTMLPVVPLRDTDGGWLRIGIEFPGRTVYLRGWHAVVGRVQLYLLDSNDLINSPGDRSITAELYGGGPQMRLKQEMVLGIGGWRLLQAIGRHCDVCHLNEGHAAFAVLERARTFMEKQQLPFDVALRATRAGNLFTTHTPVEAGFDRFDHELMAQYMGRYADTLGIGLEGLMRLGRAGRDAEEPFNMAYLAMRGSLAANGVSELHGEVSRRIFQPLFPRWPRREVPVGYVTNGVHVPSWDSATADKLWTNACGEKRWLGTLENIERNLRHIDDERLWSVRGAARAEMVNAVRTRVTRQRAARGSANHCHHLLDPNILTIGFARRFAAYKRTTLLLHDPERLVRLLTNPVHPVQLVLAGKAHPRDEEGKRMVRAWNDFASRPELHHRVVFIEDYDLSLAAELVQGVDVWINTPRRPWEASGTSGMKVLVNGGLNLSEQDGWWAEAYAPDVGWALGDRQEHDSDPAWDRKEAEDLYRILEQEVVPLFYQTDAAGIPAAWVARMRESMARLTPRFSTNRMLREYTEQYYLPGAAAYRERTADACLLARQLENWHQQIVEQWESVRFGHLELNEQEERWQIEVQLFLGELTPDAVAVEMYADASEYAGAETVILQRDGGVAGTVNGYRYLGELTKRRPITDYTARVHPAHPLAAVPFELPLILWQR